MATKKQSSSGVFDVSKPGKSGLPASSTTRAIIVSNRPLMRDPMMSEPSKGDLTPPPVKPSPKMTIQPLHDTVEHEPKAEPAPQANVQAAQPAEVTPKPPEGFPEPAPDAAIKPEEAPGVPPENEEREVDTELARKHAARLQKMIEEEEYFLPIKTMEERRSRKVAIIGLLLIIVLAAAWYDVALDAGLLPNTYDLPHTSFFTVK